MKKKTLITLIVGMVALLSMLSLPVFAQESESIPVSGGYYYVPEILSAVELDGTVYSDVVDEEFYSGDFEGTAVSSYRAVISPTGTWDAWVLTEFSGTVLGDMEGTMTIMFIYSRYANTAEWFGEWWILGGTGDLANIHGTGVAWGPGFNPEDPTTTTPTTFYKGDLIIPASE